VSKKKTSAFVPKVLELFGRSTAVASEDWRAVIRECECPYLGRKCVKGRKSLPDVLLGTCTVSQGARDRSPVIICPHRLLERTQIFLDCIHLLTLHQPGNELHMLPQVEVPGGDVDYVLASVSDGKVKDFAGIELQTLDTTGSVWSDRQAFLHSRGVPIAPGDLAGDGYGMNWKMSAKTILMQLHHKIGTFEHLSKRLVLVLQESFLSYIRKEFSADKVVTARLGDSMHFHAYELARHEDEVRLRLGSRWSTDAAGVAHLLGSHASSRVELEAIIARLEGKLSERTRMTFDRMVPALVAPPAS